MRIRKKFKRERLGPTAQKVLLLLMAGASLSLTRRPDYYFRVLKSAAREWGKINQRTLYKAIRKLYQSQMIDYKEDKKGIATITLSLSGKKRILRYDLDNMKIKKPLKWDGYWRIVVFDIPEDEKKARSALRIKLKDLGFYPLQKSVFIHPYGCKDEIDFIVEIFNLKPYVRLFTVKETDIELDLKNRFKL